MHAVVRVVLVLGAMVLIAAPDVGAHGPPVQADPQTHDQLAGLDRTWNLRDTDDEALVDLEGDAAPDTAPGVAFRIHSDVAFIEGVLTTVRDTDGTEEALFNTGSRLQAIDLEPPLALADGGTLQRVFLGPLHFATPVLATPEDSVASILRFATVANVTRPDANGTAPAADDTTPTGITIRWTTEVTDRARAHPDLGLHSPAAARVRLELVVPDDAVDGGLPADQTARLATVFDFGGSAPGRTVAPGDPAPNIDAYGIFLVRDGHWAYTRAAPDAYPVGVAPAAAHQAAGEAGLETGSATYGAPSYNRAPTTSTAQLLSPLAFNVTLPLIALPDGDPAAPGQGVGWELELGYQVDETVSFTGPDNDGQVDVPETDDTDEQTTPAPGGVVGLLVMTGALLVCHGRDRIRRARRRR